MSVYRELGTSPASYRRDDALALMSEGRHLSTPVNADSSLSPRLISRKRGGRLSFSSNRETISEESEEDDEPINSIPISPASTSTASTYRPISAPTERSNLLPKIDARRYSATLHETPTLLDEKEERTTESLAKDEFSVLIKYTLPIWITHMLENSLVMATVIAVGHLGKIELAASSIASMTGNVAALSIIHGFVAALDSLCPAAYTSAHPKMTSVYALRTAVLLALLLVPQVIIFWNATSILLLLRQDPRVAELAGQYLKILSFGLPGYATYEVIRRWLQAQGLMQPATFVVFIVAPLNILLNYLLVWDERIGIGFKGAPLASAISMDLMGALLLIYCTLFAPKNAWSGFTMAAFRNLGPNFRLGLAGVALVASEWWSWEIVGLASSFLGTTALAAQSCLLVTSGISYQAPFAASAAAAVRVGNLLGANQPRRAKIATKVALVFGFLIGVANSLLLVLNRHRLGLIFTSEKDVIVLIASILPLVALFQVFDSVCGVAGGVLRGANRAPFGAALNMASYYIIGLPLGLLLTFWDKTSLGLYGLWIGLAAALGVNSAAFTLYALSIDFDVEARKAAVRAASENT